MVRRLPYTLEVFEITEAEYNPENGNVTAGTEEWKVISKCRDEANGAGSKIVTEDSEVYTYGAVIYLPINCPKVDTGAKVRVRDNEGNIRLEGNNKLFKKEQLHARVWL